MIALPQELVDRLIAERRKHVVPSQLRPLASSFVHQCLGALFPHFAPTVVCSEDSVREDLIHVEEALRRLERSVGLLHERMPERLVERFFGALADVHDRLNEDAKAIFQGDPEFVRLSDTYADLWRKTQEEYARKEAENTPADPT